MLEERVDIWDVHARGEWVCITTNGVIKQNGQAVMGAGVALQAARKFPELPGRLALSLKMYGNHTYVFRDIRIITFPTKNDWRNDSDISLIKQSAGELATWLECNRHVTRVYLPRPGCNNGKLNWDDVKAVISSILDDRVIICTPP